MHARGLARLVWALVLATPAVAAAHPMGNFSISHYAAIQVAPDGVRLRYLLDLAEIPTFQALQAAGLPPEPEHPAVQTFAAERVAVLADGLVVELDGRRLALRVETSEVIFPPGAGGLPTLKLGAVYRAALPPAEGGTAVVLTYRDTNYAERAGWKEIIATAGPAVTILASTVPAHDRSRELADYPTDPAASPPQVLEARLVVARPVAPSVVARESPPPDGPAAPRGKGIGAARSRHAPGPGSSSPNGSAVPMAIPPEDARERHPAGEAPAAVAPLPPAAPRAEMLGLTMTAPGTSRTAFTALIADRPLGASMVLFALAVAASLGAFHALEPGHGKTVVAAYLVGARGTAWHAVLLGLVVTASHTAGVYLLGAVTLYASRYVVPERLYPWLGAASGLLIVALGANLLYRRLRGARPPARDGALAPGHAHGAGHEHSHGGDLAPAHSHGGAHGHDEHGHHHHVPEGPVSLRALVALGVSGGIVPCPAALVVLLSAIAGRQVGLGLLLIVAFSIGLAAVLIAIGLLVVYARRLVAGFDRTGLEGALVHRWLPLTSATVMTVAGFVITFQALGR
jgi:ABC-type nickel/cobalt efflux system permease component RcnA